MISQIRIFTQIILVLINRRPHLLGPAGSGWMAMVITVEDLLGLGLALVLLLLMLSLSPANRSWSATYV